MRERGRRPHLGGGERELTEQNARCQSQYKKVRDFLVLLSDTYRLKLNSSVTCKTQVEGGGRGEGAGWVERERAGAGLASSLVKFGEACLQGAPVGERGPGAAARREQVESARARAARKEAQSGGKSDRNQSNVNKATDPFHKATNDRQEALVHEKLGHWTVFVQPSHACIL